MISGAARGSIVDLPVCDDADAEPLPEAPAEAGRSPIFATKLVLDAGSIGQRSVSGCQRCSMHAATTCFASRVWCARPLDGRCCKPCERPCSLPRSYPSRMSGGQRHGHHRAGATAGGSQAVARKFCSGEKNLTRAPHGKFAGAWAKSSSAACLLQLSRHHTGGSTAMSACRRCGLPNVCAAADGDALPFAQLLAWRRFPRDSCAPFLAST